MRQKAFNALLYLGVKYSSIQHYIDKSWLNPNDHNQFKKIFKEIHRDSSDTIEDWHFDFYMGAGCKVGCPTSKKCITVWQTRFNNGEKEVYTLEKFHWNELFDAVWELKYNSTVSAERYEQLELVF